MKGSVERTAQAHVVIVDHRHANLPVLARRVTDAGFRVSTAPGCQSALAALRRFPADLVIAELDLPGMAAEEFVRAIHSEPANRDIPIIFIAARSDSSGAVRALGAGAEDVIVKPFEFDVLIAKLARLLARAATLKTLQETNAALDARIVTRAIELGEMRDRWLSSESERLRLQRLIGPPA